MGAGEEVQAMQGTVQAGYIRRVRCPHCLRLGDLAGRDGGRVDHNLTAESGRTAGGQRPSQRVQRLDLDRHTYPSFIQLLIPTRLWCLNLVNITNMGHYSPSSERPPSMLTASALRSKACVLHLTSELLIQIL